MLLTELTSGWQLFTGSIPASLNYSGTYHPDDEDLIPLNLVLIEKEIDSPGIAGLNHDGGSFVSSVEEIPDQIMAACLVENKLIYLCWLIDKQWSSS